MNFSGFLAWWLWRTVYLLKLPRLEKKVRVMLDWTLDLVFTKDLVQFETARSRSVTGTGRPGRGSLGRPGCPHSPSLFPSFPPTLPKATRTVADAAPAPSMSRGVKKAYRRYAPTGTLFGSCQVAL